MTETLTTMQWDAEYKKGKYPLGEAPVPFVGRIIDELGENGKSLFGLYPGCGNGRNFIPLLEAGLDIRGLDTSAEGVSQLLERHPEAQSRVRVGTFEALTSARVFDYIVAIQIFQHGNEQQIKKYFSTCSDALKPDGRLFLRVNSVSTEIYENHHKIETNSNGGFTVVYDSGPKKDSPVHFYSEPELREIADGFGFNIVGGLSETVEHRKPPKDGAWAQWESVWQKN